MEQKIEEASARKRANHESSGLSSPTKYPDVRVVEATFY